MAFRTTVDQFTDSLNKAAQVQVALTDDVIRLLNASKKMTANQIVLRTGDVHQANLMLTGDQNIADLSAYYAAHGAVEGQSAPKAPPAASAEIVALLNKTNCASCHGANFNVAISPAYAKLAGQHADYLYVALKAYQTDNNPRIGRANPIMASIAKQYTNAELKLLANYLSKVDGDLKTVSEKRFR